MHALRSPQKLLMIRHRKYHTDFYEDEDFYTLHAEDQLPMCPNRKYFGMPAIQFPIRDSRIIGSCNGILCLFVPLENRISLWNPSIRCKITLPDCPWRCYYMVEIGFGFDPITECYKIVSIPNPNCGSIIEDSSFVYNIKTRAWCTIAPPTHFVYEGGFKSVFSEWSIALVGRTL
ncbi:unnamed protein product [Lactuca virosa]|uniref:F-box associated beta-propeller type 3 domain-containing protein n=1 Tax=Lactuca virosa TaxID=75947 RepID=A0AAU9MI48_9ASTR|nr:unnamed protein product [Lactuca virosa]